jgi:hypothetical protein
MTPKSPIRYLCLLLLLVAANLSYGQYLNKLHDYDTTADWGMDIFIKDDGTYFVFGGAKDTWAPWSQMNMTISADGNTVISKRRLVDDSAGLYNGDYGQTKKIVGGYLVPIVVQYPNYITGYLYSKGGFIKYNNDGDTVFMKTYTDTSQYFERILNCDVMPDGGFVGGGGHGLNTPTYPSGLVIRTDSVGDTLWTHTYQLHATQATEVNSVLSLPDGRIVVGLQSRYTVSTTDVYYHFTPWFVLLDGLGNIIRDTVYGTKYGGGARMYKDSLGGFLHTGSIDSMATAFADDYENFPSYIAHLDTNFSIAWITRFTFIPGIGHRYPASATQLRDGNYMVYGVVGRPMQMWAWAAKVNRNDGNIMWCRYYLSDSVNNAYFTDVAEKADGSLVFVGATMNDTLPSWHQVRDVWIVGTDSNGCPVADCDVPALVQPVAAQHLSIYPNPTTGTITINAPQAGEMVVCNIQGQVIMQMHVKKGATEMSLPSTTSAGMYICRYIADSGDKTPVVVKLIYQP